MFSLYDMSSVWCTLPLSFPRIHLALSRECVYWHTAYCCTVLAVFARSVYFFFLSFDSHIIYLLGSYSMFCCCFFFILKLAFRCWPAIIPAYNIGWGMLFFKCAHNYNINYNTFEYARSLLLAKSLLFGIYWFHDFFWTDSMLHRFHLLSRAGHSLHLTLSSRNGNRVIYLLLCPSDSVLDTISIFSMCIF